MGIGPTFQPPAHPALPAFSPPSTDELRADNAGGAKPFFGFVTGVPSAAVFLVVGAEVCGSVPIQTGTVYYKSGTTALIGQKSVAKLKVRFDNFCEPHFTSEWLNQLIVRARKAGVQVGGITMGRGEYYRNKYGGGGRGGGRGGGGRGDSGGYGGYGGGGGGGGWRGNSGRPSSSMSSASAPPATWQQLGDLLQDIHNRNYGSYHELERLFSYSDNDGLALTLGFDHIQGDPYASPSRAHVQVDPASAGFPPEMFRAKIRNVALCDYLTRKFAAAARSAGADAKTRECTVEGMVWLQLMLMLICVLCRVPQAATRGTAQREEKSRLIRPGNT